MFMMQPSAVDVTGFGLEFGQVGWAAQHTQIGLFVDHGFDPQRPALFQVLLAAGGACIQSSTDERESACTSYRYAFPREAWVSGSTFDRDQQPR
jgi:hypothetical protein